MALKSKSLRQVIAVASPVLEVHRDQSESQSIFPLETRT
jgi:hypothetical protein